MKALTILAAVIGCIPFLLIACASAPIPAPSLADDVTAGDYTLRINACTARAKLLDAGTPAKRAYDDACMCDVARDAGQGDDPVLNCEGGAL